MSIPVLDTGLVSQRVISEPECTYPLTGLGCVDFAELTALVGIPLVLGPGAVS